MILIYVASETNFDSLGLGTLTPSSCLVTEELNGAYSLALSHPIDEDGKWQKIQQDCIVKVPTDDGDQLFRLYRPIKNSQNGTIDVSAIHIFYDLNDNLIEDTRPTLKDGQDAGDIILAGCQYSTPFSFSSDIADISTAYYIRKNPVEAFIGSEDQSYINRWGGEIRRNNFNIEIDQRRGSDAGMRIAYRENLTGVTMQSDISQVVTRIMPTALDENGVVFYTDVKYYDSPLIGNYPHPKIGILDTKIRVGQEVNGVVPYPTITSAKTAMAEMAQAAFDAGADKPEVSISVTHVNLGDTDEYAAYKDIIKKAHMGDDVTLEHPELGIDVKLRVVKIEWDAVVNRISAITLGSQMPNYANTAVSRDIDISALKSSVPTNLQENGVYNGCYINHEDGYVTEATISGKNITTKQNSYDGFAIYEGSTFLGGIKVVNNIAALIAGILTNNIDDACYATIGSSTIDGNLYRGILIFHNDFSTTLPIAKIVAFADGTISIESNSGACLAIFPNGTLQYRDANGKERMAIAAGGELMVRDASENVQMYLAASDSYIKKPSGTNHAIGVDNTGPYYVKSGTKVYF